MEIFTNLCKKFCEYPPSRLSLIVHIVIQSKTYLTVLYVEINLGAILLVELLNGNFLKKCINTLLVKLTPSL
jgi:hypothetical protein